MNNINREEIFAVADALKAAGKRVTLRSVRDALGRGSFTTILQLGLREWTKRCDAAETQTRAREPAPPQVVDRLTALASDVWSIAFESAAARFAADREALEAARSALEAEQTEVTKLADELCAELDAERCARAEVAAQLQAARERAEVVAREFTDARIGLASAEARNAELERRVTELGVELERVGGLNRELVAALPRGTGDDSLGASDRVKRRN